MEEPNSKKMVLTTEALSPSLTHYADTFTGPACPPPPNKISPTYLPFQKPLRYPPDLEYFPYSWSTFTKTRSKMLPLTLLKDVPLLLGVFLV
ncbi:hypothetical protein DSO57_1025559 [Entomophthora muscae]|uniref:Uncharacterized protein n=1 Tax=Entomophthora muscae TaxID=34485 RepID=A0ACC2S416_9FUNG|nr:hypothetical protein DSO57_1025559 [Entomophthora muscae]